MYNTLLSIEARVFFYLKKVINKRESRKVNQLPESKHPYEEMYEADIFDDLRLNLKK